ncbi:hypothetical protein FEK30_11550 [Picosynechococcus sp. PCC 11901]|uniref:P-loop ATPase, Sll1717 family n=1 Tax=Picosynechococcus sp. PCC 11901 TaxID=2579791 RepID=UPI0010FBEFC5|nr:hypothetical protein [Picosynechococcus sp. PCC 11901]QCS50018.1 hypothetical protein FEK30_11550 [Picosynechococcus sp. PCC 11901]
MLNISLGDFSAENDLNLSEYFVEDTPAYRASEDINDDRYILLGRTGSGKSAILSHINSKFRDNSNYICAFIRPEKSYLEAIIQTDEFFELKTIKGLEKILFKLIWQYVIMIEVLREKYGHNGPARKLKLLIGNDLKAYKFLNKVNQLSRENQTLADVIINLLKEIKIQIKDISVSAGKDARSSSYEVTHGLIKETESFHKNGFWDVVGGAKLYLLFDDLDLGWNPEDENQQLLLGSLFMVMKDYVYRERVKPLIALRTNILEGLDLPQREKFDNNILRISWTKPKLETMLLLRFIRYSTTRKIEGMSDIFDLSSQENINSPVDYMIKRTLYRPRDLLAFCMHAIEETSKIGCGKITIKNVVDAESQYSLNRTQALADEWKYLYPDLDSLVKLLIKIAKNTGNLEDISPKKLKEILIEAKERILTTPEPNHFYENIKWLGSYFPDDNSPGEIVNRLFKLGIIGYKQLSDSRYIFSYELDKLPDIDESTYFTFHPMFEKLSTSELAFGDRNPWE